MRDICKNCHFYSAHSYGKGLCKRHSPIITSALKDCTNRGNFPNVYEEDWCGDFTQGNLAIDTRYKGYL